MYYYIDGYNYLFRNITRGVELQLQREALIYDLNHKASLLHLNIVIVFDAHHRDDGEETLTHYKHIEIIYTATNQSADDFIIKKLKNLKHPREYTLVTSDKQLARKVALESVQIESIEEFVSRINKRYKNKLLDPDTNEKEEGISYGNFYKNITPEPKVTTQHVFIPGTAEILVVKEPEIEVTRDSYEKIFTERYESEFSDLCESSLIPLPSKEKKIKKNKPEKNSETKLPHESDHDRWLRIFGSENQPDKEKQ